MLHWIGLRICRGAKFENTMNSGWNIAQLQAVPFYSALASTLEQWIWPQTWPTLADYQSLLDRLPRPVLTASGMPLRVIEQSQEKPQDWRQGYEPRIYLQGALQTRLENWHDCFNLLTWATFPRAKAALNARQYALLKARADAPTGASMAPRQPNQDALTQFDESGVIVISADPRLSKLLLDFQWKPLFWEQRSAVQAHMRCWLFGHGLMERALQPYRGLTGKGVILPVPEELFEQPLVAQVAQVDQLLAQCLSDTQRFLRPDAWAPVPLLGFPGFTSDNACAEYYGDQHTFRSGRKLKP